MTDPLTIELPLPSKLEHPNSRPHYRAKAAAVSTTRAIAKLIASQVRPEVPYKAARYRLTFWLARKMDYDGLGAWVKAQIDGLVDAGILVGDSDFRPCEIVRYSGKETAGKRAVRFEIWDESHG